MLSSVSFAMLGLLAVRAYGAARLCDGGDFSIRQPKPDERLQTRTSSTNSYGQPLG